MFRGLGKPILYAMDAETTPGTTICHFLRLDTQSFEDGVEFNPDLLTPMHKETDPRLAVLAQSFTEPQRQAFIDLIKTLSLTMGAIEGTLKFAAIPANVRPKLKQVLAIAEQKLNTYTNG